MTGTIHYTRGLGLMLMASLAGPAVAWMQPPLGDLAWLAVTASLAVALTAAHAFVLLLMVREPEDVTGAAGRPACCVASVNSPELLSRFDAVFTVPDTGARARLLEFRGRNLHGAGDW